MRIVFDYQVFEWQTYGGISRYICELASHLDQDPEIQVEILALANINRYLQNYSSELVTGFTVPNIRKTGTMRRVMNAAASKYLLHQNPPDILHKTYYQPHQLSSKKTRQVVTIHDLTHEKFPQYFPNSRDAQDKAKTIRQVDHIICISENTKRDLLEILDVDPQKVSVVYLGCDLKPLTHETVKSPIPEPYLLFVGDRDGYKNFAQLMRAYASSHTLKKDFKLVCFGRKSLSVKERHLMQELNLSEQQVVQVSGDDTALTAYYRAASLFIYPSLYEGFGMPLLEAMALGCPVACSNIGSMPEVAGDAAQLFNPYEVEDIAAAIEKVIYSSDLRSHFTDRGKKRVQEFTWQTCAEKTLSIYQSLL